MKQFLFSKKPALFITLTTLITITATLLFSGCGEKPEKEDAVTVSKGVFGTLASGETVYIYTVKNTHGMTVKLITFGAAVQALEVPDRDGTVADVTLGYDTIGGYLNQSSYFGVTAGRYANRIANGRFTLDGTEYQLTKNDGNNHLHGGTTGLHKINWNGTIVKKESGAGVTFTCQSKDGDEGYPGNVLITLTYLLTNDNELELLYEAESDKKTIMNLTHHSYFNLTGNPANTIEQHQLTIHADSYIPVNDELIPTGELLPVEGTPLNFRNGQTIGSRLQEVKGGYDHCYVLNETKDKTTPALEVYDPLSGRVLQLFTTEPGLQFYSGNFLDGSITGKKGIVYQQHTGFCIEPQKFPDSPNHDNFPSAVLYPGTKYTQKSVFKFLVR